MRQHFQSPTTRALPWTAALLGLATAALTAPSIDAAGAADAAPPTYAALVADRAAPSSAPAYAVGVRQCPPSTKPCPVLLRTSDGGHSWAAVAATGWSGGVPSAISVSGRQYLVAEAPHGGLETSRDGGATFQHLGTAALSGVDVALARQAGDATAAGADASGDAVLVSVAGGAVSTSAATTLHSPALWLTGTSPWASATPALVSGSDPHSGLPVVERCDAALACSGDSAPLTPQADSARLHVSPHYATDRLVLATTSKQLLRSTDGGATFAPVTVVSPAPANVLVTTYPAIAFTPDFDASRHAGRAYVAVFGVTGAGGRSSTFGGIYASSDGASWSRTGRSLLDHGATAVAVIGGGHVAAAYSYTSPTPPVQAGLLCSADGGASWASACPGSEGTSNSAAAAARASAASGPGSGGSSTKPGGGRHGSAAAASPGTDTTNRAAVSTSGDRGDSGRNWRLAGGALMAAALLISAALLRRRRARVDV